MPKSLSHKTDEEDVLAAITFAVEEGVAQERAAVALLLQKLEGHFWYPMAAENLKELRERVGL